MNAYRILVADDHEVVRHGLRALLEAQPGWRVCGEAASGREAVAVALNLRPDLAILDIGMPDLNGLDATREILAQVPTMKVLILSLYESEQTVQAVMNSGARGYLLKSDASRDLVRAADALRNGKAFFTPRFGHLMQPAYGRRPGEPLRASLITLTPR